MSFTISDNSSLYTGSANTAQVTISQGLNVDQSVARPIKIQPVANGYTISIGCQTFVFESLANLLYRLEEYYNNPTKIEEHFNEKKGLPVILSKKK
jgi:hypothetical protein